MRRGFLLGVVGVAMLCFPAAAGARVLLVGTYHGIKGQYTSITAAVKAAKPGDWILIAPGDYKTHAGFDPDDRPPEDTFPAGILITTPRSAPPRHEPQHGDRRRDQERPALQPHYGRPELRPQGQGERRGPERDHGLESRQCLGPEHDRLQLPRRLGPGRERVLVERRGRQRRRDEGLDRRVGLPRDLPDRHDDLLQRSERDQGRCPEGRGLGRRVRNLLEQLERRDRGTAPMRATSTTRATTSVPAVSAATRPSITPGAVERSRLLGVELGRELVVENSQFDHNEDGFDTNSQEGDNPPPQDGSCPKGVRAPVKGAVGCWVFFHNFVHDNNNPNVPTAGLAGGGPVGTGMSISGGRFDSVIDNRFVHNGAWGDVLVPFPGSGTPCTGAGEPTRLEVCIWDPFGIGVIGNTYSKNGFFGNVTNGDIALSNFYPDEPTDCSLENHDPSGALRCPTDAQQMYPKCKGKMATPSNSTPTGSAFTAQVACDSTIRSGPGARFPARPGRTTRGSTTRRSTTVSILCPQPRSSRRCPTRAPACRPTRGALRRIQSTTGSVIRSAPGRRSKASRIAARHRGPAPGTITSPVPKEEEITCAGFDVGAGRDGGVVPPPLARARVLRVGTYHGIKGQYTTIQAAVNAAKPGDWILIAPGDYKTTLQQHSRDRYPASTFPAGVLITTPRLRLRGMNRNTVIVDGTKSGPPCNSVKADQNFGPTVNGGPRGLNGIMVWKADDVWVQNMTACNFLGGNGIGRATSSGGTEAPTAEGPRGHDRRLGLPGQLSDRHEHVLHTAVATSTGGASTGSSPATGTAARGITRYASNFNDSGYYIGACDQECNQTDQPRLGASSTRSATRAPTRAACSWSRTRSSTTTRTGSTPTARTATTRRPRTAPAPREEADRSGRERLLGVHAQLRPRQQQPQRPERGSAAAGPVGTGMSISGGRNDTVIDNRFVEQQGLGRDLRALSRYRPAVHWRHAELRSVLGLRQLSVRRGRRRPDREQVHRQRLLRQSHQRRLRPAQPRVGPSGLLRHQQGLVRAPLELARRRSRAHYPKCTRRGSAQHQPPVPDRGAVRHPGRPPPFGCQPGDHYPRGPRS